MSSLFVQGFKYKQWANAQLVDCGERQLHLLPADKAEFFVRILNHTAVVDSLFISRMRGEAEQHTADNTVQTPSIAQLRETLAQHDAALIKLAQAATAEELGRVIRFKFVDDDAQGALSVEEVFLHLLTHGSNHRGMASRVLASHGLERPADTLTRYLHEVEPQRRGG